MNNLYKVDTDLLNGPVTVLYHADCQDGFGAAYAMWRALPGANYRPINYGHEPLKQIGDVSQQLLILVDFCVEPEVLLQLAAQAKHVIVIDHHPLALKCELYFGHEGSAHPNVTMCVSSHRSGAMLAWNWAHPDEPAPRLLHLVQDYDLHRFSYKETLPMTALLGSYPHDFRLWHDIAVCAEDPEKLAVFMVTGDALLRQIEQSAQEVVKQSKGFITVFGREVPCCNCPRHLTGSVSKLLLKDHTMCATYYDLPTGQRKWSFRADDTIADQSGRRWNMDELAREIGGGGGHPNAAGMVYPRWKRKGSLAVANFMEPEDEEID